MKARKKVTNPIHSEFMQHMDSVESFASFSPVDCEEVLADILDGAGPNPHVLKTSLDRVSELRLNLYQYFIGRNEAIDACLASLISGVPAVLLGPPGTAKSAIARRISEACGLKHGKLAGQPNDSSGVYFEYLLTSHTMPEELYGAPRLELLRDGVYQRNTEGMLPEAEIAFLDEIFRGGGHILNTLLSLVNERVFHDGKRIVPAPLLGIIGAANTPPFDPDIEAFYDRFPVRVWLESVLQVRGQNTDRDTRVHTGNELLKRGLDGHKDQLHQSWAREHGEKQPSFQRIACTNDLRAARTHMVLEMLNKDPATEREEFDEIFHKLRDRCGLSDRSYIALWRFATALNLLNTEDEAPTGHISVFKYVAPTQEQVGLVTDVVSRELHGKEHTSDV